MADEKVNLSLFVDDMILCIENPEDDTQKQTELIRKFNHVAGYKINLQKLVAFLHTHNKLANEKLRNHQHRQ